MATESIFEDVKITTRAQADAFANALIESAEKETPIFSSNANITHFPDINELRRLAQKKFK